MNRHAAFAIAFALALRIPQGTEAQVRVAPTPVPPSLPPIVLPGPSAPALPLAPPAALTPVLPSPAVRVLPPPKPSEKGAEADGGSCTCPGGQKLDAEGWCWQETDAAHGYWQRTQECE